MEARLIELKNIIIHEKGTDLSKIKYGEVSTKYPDLRPPIKS